MEDAEEEEAGSEMNEVTDTEIEDTGSDEQRATEEDPMLAEVVDEEQKAEEDEANIKKIIEDGPPEWCEDIRQLPAYNTTQLEPEISCAEFKDVEITSSNTFTKAKSSEREEWKNPRRSELHYYLSTLRLAVPAMKRQEDKIKLRKWIFYLLKHVTDQTLRNRYFLIVTLSALSDECFDLVKEEPPPTGRIVCLHTSIRTPCFIKPARWESDVHWEHLIPDFATQISPPCPLHNKCIPNGGLEEDTVEAVGGHLMDQEFKYLLYLIKPYVSKLSRAEDKVRVSMWIQKLSCIRPCSCAFMKGLRNDYMQVLLGYVSLGRCPGPFGKLPPQADMNPLSMEAQKYYKKEYLWELSRDAAEEFIADQTPLTNGAICYAAISGSNNGEMSFSPLDAHFGPPD